MKKNSFLIVLQYLKMYLLLFAGFLVFLGNLILNPLYKISDTVLKNLKKFVSHKGKVNKKSKKAKKKAKKRSSTKAKQKESKDIRKSFVRYFSRPKSDKKTKNKKTAKHKTKTQNKTKQQSAKSTSKSISKNTSLESKPDSKRSTGRTFVKIFLSFFAGVFFCLIFIFIPLEVKGWYNDLPQPNLLTQSQNKSTKILDRKGRLLYEVYVDRKYDPVSLKKIPDHVVHATLALEDDSFYDHNGVRPLSIIRAARATLFESNIQGGSTITQQLVKNALLSPEQTISRKVKELVLALRVEQLYKKDEILELYFNNIPYGGTAWGIQSASHKFFGKDVSELTLAESSFLAILPSAPTTYSPFSGNLELSKSRQKHVLNRMVDLGYISKLDADLAYAEELDFVPQYEYIRAPHFVNYVRDELTRLYGKRLVDLGGLTVTTTLDLDLQDAVQRIVADEVEKNSFLNISNGAAIVLDSRSGEILSYVGSRDYFDTQNDGKFDVVTALRSPGSSIKPVTYALAFEKGMTPFTIVEDAPLTIQSYGQTYSPVNYDNKFHGKVTLRSALANSYNIPAVKIMRSVGVPEMVALGKRMGIKTWNLDSSYGLAVTLGGKEVRLLDLANVYATFSRGGVYKDTTPFIAVKDANGFDIYEKNEYEERVLSAGAAYLVTNILSDYNARLPAFGTNNFLNIPGHTVAVKTGTSDDKRDNLTVGYTPSYVVGVWVGNNNNEPMNQRLASGLSGAAPMWNRIMTSLIGNFENEQFISPSDVFVKIDEKCGKSEIFIKGTAPNKLCDDKVNDRKD